MAKGGGLAGHHPAASIPGNPDSSSLANPGELAGEKRRKIALDSLKMVFFNGLLLKSEAQTAEYRMNRSVSRSEKVSAHAGAAAPIIILLLDILPLLEGVGGR